MARINLLGHGKIMQAMAKILAPCDIYDDKFSEIAFDSYGNRLLPSKEILKIAKNAESSVDSAESQNLGEKELCEAPKTRLLRGAKNRNRASSSGKADFLLEADKRGFPPKSEKAAAFWRVGGAGREVQPFLRKESSEIDENGVKVAESSADSADSQNLQDRLPRRFCESARNDEFIRDSSPTAQNDNFDVNIISIISPGIPPNHILAQNTPNIISEYDFFASQMPPSVWISGTNGKTTTTQMTALLLQDFGAQSGGNIGTPLCEMDFNAPLWVLETSSFMLHYTNIASPKIYALLPIEADHLSWHGDFERYVEAKLKPLKTMGAQSYAIIPKFYADSAECADFKGKIYFYEDAQNLAKIFDIKAQNLRFRGAFLLDSILALAICALVTGKIDYDLMNSFQIDAHKIEEFFDAQKRLFIDDSKATNISATIEALKIYKEKFIFLILGGDNKGVSLAPLVAILRDFRVKIFAIGACENHINELSAESSVPCEVCGDLQNAVAKIKCEFNDAKNQVCLLSPACASLDQFKSYVERGELFKKYALQIHLAATF